MPLNTRAGRGIVNTSLSLVRQTIQRHEFLEKNSRVLVGVSGGVDSWVLLRVLIEYNERFHQGWEIHACHVDPQFPRCTTHTLEHFLSERSVPYTIVKTKLNAKLKKSPNKCYPCARERRRRLLEVADSLTIFQVALAHHKQDVVETVLLNMMYTGSLSTLVPKQSIIHGRFFLIRPLYYFDKARIQALARIYGVPAQSSVCPYYEQSKRQVVRDFLDLIKKETPDVYTNMFRSILHINRMYLPQQ